MDKEELKRIVANPDHISGIFNYCDRWCERCLYTARCSNYALSQAQFGDATGKAVSSREFWEKLKEVFEMTSELIREIGEAKGVPVTAEDGAHARPPRTGGPGRHSCCAGAMEYIRKAEAWFKGAKPLFKRREKELRDAMTLGAEPMEITRRAGTLNDAVEMIRWYQHQIYVKLMRAVSGRMAAEDDADPVHTDDADGSAKVALIGIDHSLAGWGVIYREMPDQADGILTILACLDHLRKDVERNFPGARAFVRPGFDTGDSPVPDEKVDKP